MRWRFELGALGATPGALEESKQAHVSPVSLLARHASGDWDDVPAADAGENELSVREDFRILSSYTLPNGARLWIITERDRSATTIHYAGRVLVRGGRTN
jgi:hypothetical protein